MIPIKTTKIYDETSRLTSLPHHVISHVVSHQFRWINLQLLYPSVPVFKVYKLGTFHIPRQKLISRLHTAIHILRRKRAIPFVYDHAKRFLSTSFHLRHGTKNFNSISQVRFWTRPASNSTLAAQSAPWHHKNYRYRTPVGHTFFATLQSSGIDSNHFTPAVPPSNLND